MECCFHAGFNTASKLHKKGKNKLRRLFLHPPRTPNRRKSVFWDPPWVPQGVDVVYGCSLSSHKKHYFQISLLKNYHCVAVTPSVLGLQKNPRNLTEQEFERRRGHLDKTIS